MKYARGTETGELADLGILDAAAALRGRRCSSLELTEACLARIGERNGGKPSFDGSPHAINAFVRIYPELARESARNADHRLARAGADAPLLCGVPLALKDLYGIAGLPLTASSRVLEGSLAARDATAWARLRHQGMIPLGHTHTHEFAAGGTTDQVGNPHDLTRVAGGSSGGSAAALAARMTPAALGSDTCGSLRIPSACCGTSTIKPTRGRIPIDGIVPLSATLDHAGPMARTIADCAVLLQGMARGGSAAAAMYPPAAPLAELPTRARSGERPLAGVIVGMTDRTDRLELEAEVAAALDHAVGAAAALGAKVVTLPSPWTFDWDDLSTVLFAEVWTYHRTLSDRHERYRPSIAEFVEIARNFTDAQAYIEAQGRRAQGTALWNDWFDVSGVDVVLEPTLPVVPYRRGPGYERGHAGGAGDPLIALTAMWDMTGMPVASLPVSWQAGVSLIAPSGGEQALTQIAIDLQEHQLGIPPAPAAGR